MIRLGVDGNGLWTEAVGVFTGQNGDSITYQYKGLVPRQEAAVLITGGTGRFKGATGSGTMTWADDAKREVRIDFRPVLPGLIEANKAEFTRATRANYQEYAEHGSFEGFGPDAAAAFDPSVVYGRGTPAADMVAMSVSPTTVVFVTVVDPNGGYLCAAAMGDIVTFGRTNATMPAECQGGWD